MAGAMHLSSFAGLSRCQHYVRVCSVYAAGILEAMEAMEALSAACNVPGTVLWSPGHGDRCKHLHKIGNELAQEFIRHIRENQHDVTKLRIVLTMVQCSAGQLLAA
jgi:hypothetical protein